MGRARGEGKGGSEPRGNAQDAQPSQALLSNLKTALEFIIAEQVPFGDRRLFCSRPVAGAPTGTCGPYSGVASRGGSCS